MEREWKNESEMRGTGDTVKDKNGVTYHGMSLHEKRAQ